MSTIDDQRPVHEVDTAGPTVLQAHHAVRVVRLSHCRHGRARPVHRSRRARRPPVSQYRPSEFSGGSAEPTTTRTGIKPRRRPVPTVVIATVGLSLLYVGFVRVFGDLNNKALVLGVYLIAVTAAVCLNAFTLDAMVPPAGVRSGRSASAVPGKFAGDPRDSGPDNSKEQR